MVVVRHQVQRRGARPNRGGPAPWKRHVRNLAVMALLSAAIGALGHWLTRPQTLPINRVRIHSPLQNVEREVLREVVEPHATRGFLYLNVTELREELEALPWVSRVGVRRVWPDALEVSIEEHQAIARWGEGGLVDVGGVPFDAGERIPEGLPLLSGPPESGAQLVEFYREVGRNIAPLGLTVAELTLSDRRAWSVTLSNGLVVVLGRGDLQSRLQRLVRVYRGAIVPRLAEIERVDMRYTNGFTVRWRQTTVGAPGQSA